MTRVVWIISEGSPGHVSQSEGFTTALALKMDLESAVIQTRHKFGGLVRQLIRAWMGRTGRPLPGFFLRRWLACELPTSKPDLIVASGGKAVFTARSLAVKFNVPLVYLGERKPYPSGWFHTVFTPAVIETDACDVRMDLIPTKINSELTRLAATAWNEKPTGKLWTLLIGGSSRSHHFEIQDWERLADGMTSIARREGIRWLVSTSRRTGLAQEDLLRSLLPPEIVANSVWWCRSPQQKFAAYLGAAEMIWVTQDSVSMVTEAVSARKPVVALYPERVSFPPSSFMPGYLENLVQLGLLWRVPIASMHEFKKPVASTSFTHLQTNATLVEIALQRLGWMR